MKAIQSASWQLNAGQFIDVEVREGEQFVRGKRTIASASRICIFVVVKGTGHDEFYVFPWEDLQDILLQDYKAGARPKNPDTLHRRALSETYRAFQRQLDGDRARSEAADGDRLGGGRSTPSKSSPKAKRPRDLAQHLLAEAGHRIASGYVRGFPPLRAVSQRSDPKRSRQFATPSRCPA